MLLGPRQVDASERYDVIYDQQENSFSHALLGLWLGCC
jgi:hypothetical protein